MSISKYGVWITTEHFACLNGGDELSGTKEEMEKVAFDYASELKGPQRLLIRYEVRPWFDEYAIEKDETE